MNALTQHVDRRSVSIYDNVLLSIVIWKSTRSEHYFFDRRNQKKIVTFVHRVRIWTRISLFSNSKED